MHHRTTYSSHRSLRFAVCGYDELFSSTTQTLAAKFCWLIISCLSGLFAEDLRVGIVGAHEVLSEAKEDR